MGLIPEVMTSSTELPKKPKVALIADVPNWAYSNISKQIINYLGNEYDFELIYVIDFDSKVSLFERFTGFDIIHIFHREELLNLFTLSELNLFYPNTAKFFEFIKRTLGNNVFTTTIFNHSSLSEEEISDREILFNGLLTTYAVCSQKLFDIYKNISVYPPPALVVTDGVSLDLFKPQNLDRLKDENREIVVGWTGNSMWGTNRDGVDHKGFHSIIKIAIEELRNEGVPVRLDYVDRNEKWLPLEEMPKFFNNIDIYLCASDQEGTPNPVLESMACGIPVISTDVGIVPEAFGPKQKEYIIPRTIPAFKEKIRFLVEHPNSRIELSKENLEWIKPWDWSHKVENWDKLFKQALFLAKIRNQKLLNYQLLRCTSHKLLAKLLVEESHKRELINVKNNLLSKIANYQSQIELLYAIQNSRTYKLVEFIKKASGWNFLRHQIINKYLRRRTNISE